MQKRKRATVSDIRSSLEPSAELKSRVIERAASLAAGKKTFGTERTAAEVKERRFSDSFTEKKENITMNTNKSYDEPARLKSHLPAALISVAACAAIIVCAAAVGLRGRDSSEEIVTESRTEVTPGAQMPAGGAEDGNTEKSYPEKEKIGSITIPNFMETQDIYSETAFEEYRDNGKNFFTVVADKSFDEYKSFDENNEVIALYAPSSMEKLKDIEQVRKSPVIELSDIDGSTRKYVILRYLNGIPSLGSEPDYIPDDLQTWTDKCGVYTSNVSFTSDDEYLSILFFPENDIERNYIIARKIKDDEDIEALSSSYRLLSDSSDTNAVTTVTEVTTSVTTTAVPITYPEETDVTTVTAVIPDESETEQLVTVPSVVGMTQAEAIAELKRAGLNFVISDTFSDETAGTVIEQSIADREQVLRGTEVMIYVSAGKEDGPISMTLQLPLPEGITGSYTIDIYRDGNIAYIKTIENAETVAGSSVGIDLVGKGTEKLAVYIKKNDVSEENYIRYAMYNVDYVNQTCELDGKLNATDLLTINEIT